MHGVIDRLLNLEADLVVTITVPLDRRRPGNDEDRIRLRNLLAEARAEVLANAEPAEARLVLDHLASAAARVDLAAGAHGAVIIATPDGGGSPPAVPGARRRLGRSHAGDPVPPPGPPS
jgi:hypothetical protein